MTPAMLKVLAATLCLFLVLQELAAAPSLYEDESSWSPSWGWSAQSNPDIVPVPERRAAGHTPDAKMLHAKINAVFTYLLKNKLKDIHAIRALSSPENLRDLYDLLLRADRGPSYTHQMERKGGRSPSLRLRFGRRADPVWEAAMGSAESGAQASGPDNPSN